MRVRPCAAGRPTAATLGIGRSPTVEPGAAPIGIRQGRRILYRHSDLVALATAHQSLLAARDYWPLLQVLEQVAAARLAVS